MSRQLVTVKTLTTQARQEGRIRLFEDALITPAAQDWLSSSSVPVERVGREAESASAVRARLYIAGDAANPVCRTLLPLLRRQHGAVEFLPCNGNRGGLMAAIQATCDALAECSDRRGVIIVRDGLIPHCVANKRPEVRAAIVSRPSQLLGVMGEMGANMLIMESDNVSLRQMQGMIETFMAGKLSIDPVVAAAIAGRNTTGSSCSASGGGC